MLLVASCSNHGAISQTVCTAHGAVSAILCLCQILNCFALRQELWLLDENAIYSLKLLGGGSGLVGAGMKGKGEQWWGSEQSVGMYVYKSVTMKPLFFILSKNKNETGV